MMHNLNPAFKALNLLITSFLLTFEYNYFVNFSIFLLSTILLIHNKIKFKKLFFSFLPVFIMSFGIFISGYLYGNNNEINLNNLSKTLIINDNVDTGLILSSKLLAYCGIGFLFIYTTNSRKLIISLMQEFALPKKFAYAIIAAYNFIPTIKKEYLNTINAYKARGIKKQYSSYQFLLML